MWRNLSKSTRKLIRLFLIVSGTTAVIFGAILGVGVLTYNKFIHQDEPKKVVNSTQDEIVSDEVDKELEEKETSVLNKTVAVLGTDVTGMLTDVILVANFNSETNEANVISVPRDTRVVWTESQREYLREGRGWVTASKLNEMSSHTGIKNIRGGTINYLETLLGVAIDNYVIVSTSAFRDIVNALGGIEIDVPVRMKKDDYSQNLHIDLYPGVQQLSGEQAEGFVRYRDYPRGDLDRIKAQQAFMEVFAKKIMSPSIIMKLPNIINVVFNSVKTDIKISELPEYMPYIKKFDVNKLYFHTIPGTDGRIEGLSYYIIDDEQKELIIDEIFNN